MGRLIGATHELARANLKMRAQTRDMSLRKSGCASCSKLVALRDAEDTPGAASSEDDTLPGCQARGGNEMAVEEIE